MDEEKTIDDIIDREGRGKLTNRKADLGGWTYSGVTFASWRRIARKTGAIPLLTQDEFIERARAASKDPDHPFNLDVRIAYKVEYIEPYKGLPRGLREAITDAGVNLGPPRASKILQQVLCVAQDGVVGVKTLGAARDLWRAGKPARVEALVAVADARLDWYIRLARRKPQQMANLRGWKNRTMSVLQESLEAL